jgi:tripartite-type tricarboxylate transporter receptor subunit TctC
MESVAKLFLIAAALAITAHGAAAEDYPTRAIRVSVPYGPGGPSDTGARIAAEALSRQLGKSVIVENHGGGGGLNATESYLKEAPDGYTILVGSIGPLTIIPAGKKVSYDSVKDFVPIGTVWRSALTLAVRPSMGVKSMAEFVAYAKEHPGKVTIGSAGVGSVTHLAIELLKREANINVIHVPFRSSGQSMPALMGGQIDALFGDTPIIAPQIKAGTINALAVASPKRELALPDVPTMAESGLPAVEAASWFGFVVLAQTPPAIVKRLQDALTTGQKDPAYIARLAAMGASSGEVGPASYAELIKKDAVKWKAIMDAAGIKLE